MLRKIWSIWRTRNIWWIRSIWHILWVVLVKKVQPKIFIYKNPNSKIHENQLLYLKTWPNGAWNCIVPNFCETGFRYICILFTSTYGKFVPYATEIFMQKNQNYLLGRADLGIFLSYGLRTTIKITIFSTFFIDSFSSCYSWNLCKKIQTLSIKTFF